MIQLLIQEHLPVAEPQATKPGVIAGFDEGIMKMRVGEKAALIIPSKIGYGTNGSGTIPPNSPLYFEVEVVGAL